MIYITTYALCYNSVIQITIRNAACDRGYNLALTITSSYDNYGGLRYIPVEGNVQCFKHTHATSIAYQSPIQVGHETRLCLY